MESYSNVEINTKVQEIIKKIQVAQEKLEKSSFYTKFMKQIQNPEMLARIERVIGTDPDHSQLQVVLYGVGALEPNEKKPVVEPNHMQFCLAILLREKFEWVHDIVVYDPVLSTIERKAISAFDCTCLSANENGRRTVNKPTLFFMPHCNFLLTDSALEANWSPENLNKIIILCNSLKSYDLYKENFAYYRLTNKMQVILDSEHMLHEMPLPQRTISLEGADDFSIEPLYRVSFHDLSWHFFDWDGSLHGFQRQDPEMFAPNYVKTKKMVEEIIKKIHLGRDMLENSSFYRKIKEQMQDPEMVTRIENVIATDPQHSKLQIVLLGIAARELHKETMQLAFAILLREKFGWVNDIMVYDTYISTVERKALKALNCSFLSRSKRGRWSVDRPTLFFMSGPQMFRYVKSIVDANWTPAKLNKIIIIGQSCKDFTGNSGSRESKTVRNNELLLHEMPLPHTANKILRADIRQDGSTLPNKDCSVDPDSVYLEAFNGFSWHFFRWDGLFDGVSRENVPSFFGWDHLRDVSVMDVPSYFSELIFPHSEHQRDHIR